MPRRPLTHAAPDDVLLAQTIREKLSERITASNAQELARTSFTRKADIARALGVSTRTVERWYTTRGTEKRNPSAVSKQKLSNVLKTSPEANRAALHRLASESASLEIALEGEVKISDDTRYRRLPARGAVSMTGATALDFLEAGINGESQRAYDVFFEAHHMTPGTVGAPVIELVIQ